MQEVAGGHDRAVGLHPADQGLVAGDPAVGEAHDRLEPRLDLAVRQRLLQLGLKGQRLLRLVGRRVVEQVPGVRAAPSGLAHGDRGVADQFLGRAAVRQGDPDAGGHVDLVGPERDRAGHCLQQALCGRRRVGGRADLRKEDDELVTGDAGDPVAGAGGGDQPGGDLLQHSVAGEVGEGLVDAGEPVHAGAQQRPGARPPMVEEVLDPPQPEGQARHAGEGVVIDLALEVGPHSQLLLDVAHLLDAADPLARGVGEDPLHDPHPLPLTRGSEDPQLARIGAAARIEDPLLLGAGALEVARMKELGNGPAEEVVRIPAQHRSGGRRRPCDPPVGIGAQHHVARALRQEPVALALVLQGLPRGHLLGDVAGGAEEHHAAVGLGVPGAAVLGPDGAAVAGDPADGEGDGLTFGAGCGGEQRTTVAGVEQSLAQVGVGVVVLRRVPDQRRHGGGHVGEAGRGRKLDGVDDIDELRGHLRRGEGMRRLLVVVVHSTPCSRW